MATIPHLIYCANGNPRFAQIAIDAGFHYGAQLPGTVYLSPLWFADQNWKRPNRDKYMKALARYKPYMASVLDWEHEEQLNDILDWAHEAAQFVETIMLIPKVMGGISKLPRTITNKPVVLGYSVPTRFGGTQLPMWAFDGWPIHLLGGTPHKQIELWHYFSLRAEVYSVDGNYHQKMAMWCQFWSPNAPYAKDRHWPRLAEADGKKWEEDGIYEAFARSCQNIGAAWNALFENN
ncbi:MAG: hypothetical protein GYA36_23215 [Veillonellaceae bacterium]|nr:hypothetical protein [Veillonellaceae bacterium]